MPQYSMVGNVLDSQVPGEYYDSADISRRKEAMRLSDLISSNKNFKRIGNSPNQPSAAYLSDGLSYDVEGLLNAYAMKYGKDNALNLLDALPNMSRSDLMEVQKSVENAADEYQNMQKREYQAYRRAGAYK